MGGLTLCGPAAAGKVPFGVAIVRIAREQSADLIVVGSHGRGVLARAILGSTADKVVRTAHCPVLVVAHEH